MLYLHIILFVFISCTLYPCYESNVINQKSDGDTVDLSQKTIDEIESKYKNVDPAVIEDIKNLRSADKRKEMQLQQKEMQLKKVQEQTFLNWFSCAVYTTKADISRMNAEYQIFYPVEHRGLRNLNPPAYFIRLIRHCDGPAEANYSVDKNLKLQSDRFRYFYFRLKEEEIDNSTLIRNLRELLQTEYAPKNNKELDEVNINFAATIVRVNSFFSGHHYQGFSKLLTEIRRFRKDDVLNHLFSINYQWFLNHEYINNINILRRAYYGKDVPKIVGYKSRNKAGEDVEIPLYFECGQQTGFTLLPEKLEI